MNLDSYFVNRNCSRNRPHHQPLLPLPWCGCGRRAFATPHPFTLVTVDYAREPAELATKIDFTFQCLLPSNLAKVRGTIGQVFVGCLPLSRPVTVSEMEKARLALGCYGLRPAELVETLSLLHQRISACPFGRLWSLGPVPLGNSRSAVWPESERYPCVFHQASTESNPRLLNLFLFPPPTTIEAGDYLLVVDKFV